eukprot:1093077-Rhodomonas_salina.1
MFVLEGIAQVAKEQPITEDITEDTGTPPPYYPTRNPLPYLIHTLPPLLYHAVLYCPTLFSYPYSPGRIVPCYAILQLVWLYAAL